MFTRKCSWDGVYITYHEADTTFRSGMGSNSRWHAIREGQYVIIVSWDTSIPYTSVEVFDLDDNDRESFAAMGQQEHQLYESFPSWDTLSQENDERIGTSLWNVYQHHLMD